jgi:hypothetical protein
LHIENCIFPGNTLSIEWLPVLNTTIIISQLHVTTSVPITIEENAFSHNNFQNITYLTLQGSIAQLNKKCFAGLQHLDTLLIYGDLIQSVARGILNDVPNLSTLQIESGISDDYLMSFLQNTTLDSLKALHIGYNNFTKLKSENLRGLTNLVTLNAGSSHITSIESTILESSAKTIQLVIFSNNDLETLPVEIFNIKSRRECFQVQLQQNKLKTLPKGIFDMATQSSDKVEAYLQNNSWHCDCDLAWLQNYIDQKIIHVADSPECKSPEINKNKSLRDADFSDCNTITLPSASSTTTTETTTSSTTETATSETTTPSTTGTTADSATSTTKTTCDTTTSCTQDNNTTVLSTEVTTSTTTSSTEVTTSTPTPSTLRCNSITYSRTHIHILTESSFTISPLKMRGIRSFEIEENEVTGEITATIEAEIGHVLIWKNNSNDCHYKEFNAQKQRSLQKTTFETDPDTSYTICAARISEGEITVPLLNCRAHTTLPSSEDRPLFLIKDKYITLAISCFALLVIVIISGAICYNVVLYNPKLLKGNKRVIVVQRHECEVGLGMHGENDKPRSSQTTYSTVSTGQATYLTLYEPTTVEQISWNCREMCDTLSDWKTESAIVFFPKEEPPPLPLYRMSCTSDTSCNTEPKSETTYVKINESTKVRVMAWLCSQMRVELPDNCITEDANESHS